MKLKNKYGFTLIELLAVIVVLAIIALIATPIVMNTIKRSKKGAAERSADSYVKQVEVAVATEKLTSGEVLDGEYQITSDGNLCRDKSASCSDDEKIKIEMNGDKPSSGKIKIANGTVDQASSNMTIGDYDVTYNSTKKTYEATEKGNSTTPDTPQVEVLCTAKTTATTGNVPSGNYAYGDEYTCELGDNDAKTFFVLETSGDKVSLIMSENLIDRVIWCTKEDYLAAGGIDTDYETGNLGPLTALSILKDKISTWKYLSSSQVTIPSGEQIAKASGISGWDKNETPGGEELPSWISTQSYWTSTPSFVNSEAWIVLEAGNYPTGVLYTSGGYISDSSWGLRPVITISKSQLN